MSMPAEETKAPAFKGKDQDDNIISLGSYKGKKVVLLSGRRYAYLYHTGLQP